MKKRFRLFLLVAAALLGLALVAAALAGSGSTRLAVHQAVLKPIASTGYTTPPELAVQQASYKLGGKSDPGFVFFSDPNSTNDATAKMTIFSPAGYASNLTQAPGTPVGKAFAMVRSGTLGGADLPLSGPVVVGNPADPNLQAASAQCRGTTTNQEILVLNTSLQNQAIQVPDFINTVGPYVTQEICLPPPETAQFQAKVWLAIFTIKGVFTNASTAGQYEWAGDYTPYNGLTPNPAQTVEVRTFVGLPSTLTFKRVKSKPSVVKFAGKLSINGARTKGKLDLYFSTKSQPARNYLNPSPHCILDTCKIARTTSLKANGTFAATRPKVKKRTFFQIFLNDGWLFQTCAGPSPSGQPIPCVRENLAPMITNQIRVLPPKKKKRHH
jgi:hypothetical protein